MSRFKTQCSSSRHSLRGSLGNLQTGVGSGSHMEVTTITSAAKVQEQDETAFETRSGGGRDGTCDVVCVDGELGSGYSDLGANADLRSMLSTHDEEQIFLDPAEKAMATRRQAIAQKIQWLGRPMAAMFVISGALFLTAAGVWLWHGLNHEVDARAGEMGRRAERHEEGNFMVSMKFVNSLSSLAVQAYGVLEYATLGRVETAAGDGIAGVAEEAG